MLSPFCAVFERRREMTIKEAIEIVDGFKPNAYDEKTKVRWLSSLDMQIQVELIDTHEGGGERFTGYTENTSTDTVLLVAAPFDEIYRWWLEAQIDYANGEFERYGASMSMFNAAFARYEDHYAQYHRPLQKARWRW